MLKKHNFLVDRLWVVKEIKLINLISKAFHGLSIAVHDRLLLASLNVIEVELVRVQDNFGAVVEEYTIRAVGELVTKAVL